MIIDWSSNEVENKDPSWGLTAVGGRRIVTTDAEVVVSLATAEGDNNCEFATDSTWIMTEKPTKK
jgi:hypothetical protein